MHFVLFFLFQTALPGTNTLICPVIFSSSVFWTYFQQHMDSADNTPLYLNFKESM